MSNFYKVFRLLVLSVWMSLGPDAPAQTVSMPDKLTIQKRANGSYPLASVTIAYDGTGFQYGVVGGDADVFREYTEQPNSVKLRILPAAEGVITVIAYCAKGDKSSPFTVCTITVTSPTPVVPVPVVPTDPMAKSLADAYQADANPAKARLVHDLATLHRAVAQSVLGDANLKVNADCLATLKLTIANSPTLRGGALPGVKAVVSTYLNSLRLSPAAPLTAATRQSIANVLTTSASYLEKLS